MADAAPDIPPALAPATAESTRSCPVSTPLVAPVTAPLKILVVTPLGSIAFNEALISFMADKSRT